MTTPVCKNELLIDRKILIKFAVFIHQTDYKLNCSDTFIIKSSSKCFQALITSNLSNNCLFLVTAELELNKKHQHILIEFFEKE